MKKIAAILSLLLTMSLLAGCMGTPVVYQCDCPTEGETDTDKLNRRTLTADVSVKRGSENGSQKGVVAALDEGLNEVFNDLPMALREYGYVIIGRKAIVVEPLRYGESVFGKHRINFIF